MIIAFFTSFFRRRNRRRLRDIMRGYRRLKEADSLNRISEIKRELTVLQLSIPDENFSRWLFGAGTAKASLVLRQYLLIRAAGLNLNRALLCAMGKPDSSVVHYLPPEWRKVIEKHGFGVSNLRTALAWNAFVAMMFAYGISKIALILYEGIAAALRRKSVEDLGRFVYFNGLTTGNLPQPCRDGRSHDIVTWYAQWEDRDSDIDTFCHRVTGAERREVKGIPVVPVSGPTPPLKHFASHVRFFIWGIGATLISLFDFLRGRWWHAIMLNQAALGAKMRIQNSAVNAKDYLFHNSDWIYRPLWTYEAEKRGSRIIFYFYSTNCEEFKRAEGYPPMPYGWEAMNWPHYLVWDEFQADFIRRAVGLEASISVVGPIWFHTSDIEITPISLPGIAVFDVTPHRESRYCTLGLLDEYYVPSTNKYFLEHILDAIQPIGAVMLWKPKRKIGAFAHPLYLDMAERLNGREDVAVIDPDISALRVIESSAAVISMPFTSTALIARELGKPSCYYDPAGLIQKDDRAGHGITIISGFKELVAWLKDLDIPSQPTRDDKINLASKLYKE